MLVIDVAVDLEHAAERLAKDLAQVDRSTAAQVVIVRLRHGLVAVTRRNVMCVAKVTAAMRVHRCRNSALRREHGNDQGEETEADERGTLRVHRTSR